MALSHEEEEDNDDGDDEKVVEETKKKEVEGKRWRSKKKENKRKTEGEMDTGFRELTEEIRYRAPRSPRALHSQRSLISIRRGPVERSNSKERDGWRYYERLRIRKARPIPRSAFSC